MKSTLYYVHLTIIFSFIITQLISKALTVIISANVLAPKEPSSNIIESTQLIESTLEKNNTSLTEAKLALAKPLYLFELDQYQLELLPGISSVKAMAMLQVIKNNYSQLKNATANTELDQHELLYKLLVNVKGIGKKTAKSLQTMLTLNNPQNDLTLAQLTEENVAAVNPQHN